MLRCRDVYYEEFNQTITIDKKNQIIKELIQPRYGKPFIEFLYLNGDRKGWNWGASGRTNAVFIQKEARDYFRPYF